MGAGQLDHATTVALYRRFRSHRAHGTKKAGDSAPRPSTTSQFYSETSFCYRPGPNQLGPAYNLHVLQAFAEHVAPALGWKPNTEGSVQGDPVA